jgi:hypothetical protein
MKLRQNGTVFLMIKLAASMAEPGLNSEPQNIEYRTAACDELSRVEFRRIESLCSVFF